MAVALYDDPDLVAVYDLLNPPGDEVKFLLSLLSASPQRVLDVGCGTGRLATELARMGHRAVGLEPSGLMLDRARTRPGGEPVTWICSDAAALAVEMRFDLAVMAGHVFQVFLDDEEARAVLRRIRDHLAPAGQLVFSSRNPAAREWETWTPALSAETFSDTPLGDLAAYWEVTEVDGPLVTYATHVQVGAGPPHRGIDTIRFRSQIEIEALLGDARFSAAAWYGDWQRAPWDPSQREIVVIAGPVA